ncbi:MAG: hypothetical protein KF878_26665 [Planctomycetes bacterium]|nr:hypothetical protein [Planctomycetota bacterium]
MSPRRTPTPAPEDLADPARARLPWFDAIWERLPTSARLVFLWAVSEDANPVDDPAGEALLIVHGLLVRRRGRGLEVGPDALGFADRIGRLDEAPVLERGTDDDLAVTAACVVRGSSLFELALRGLPGASASSGEGLAALARRPEWLERLRPLLGRLPGVTRALDVLARAGGLMPLPRFCEEVGAAAYPALDVLVTHLAVFEGLDEDLGLMVGLLPEHRRALASGEVAGRAPKPPRATRSKSAAEQPAPPPALATVPRPTEIEATGAPLLLDDLEALLHALAETKVRTSQRGELYVDDEAQVHAALGARPSRVGPIELRAGLALELAAGLGLVREVDPGGARGPRLLRPASDAGEFLDRPLRDRWRTVVEHLLAEERHDWLGGVLDALAARMGGWPVTRERTALAAAPLLALEPGRWVELRALLASHAGEQNPLYQLFVARQKERGVDLADWRPLLTTQLRYTIDEPDLRDPLAALDRAYARAFVGLLARLALVGGVELGDLPSPRAALAITPVGRHYLGLERRFPAIDLADDPPGKVVVQPNLEVLVLGRAPAARLRLAALATPRPGESGPARTFVLSRDRVIDLVAAGQRPDEVLHALVEAARGAEVPLNVARTVQDWARAVRRARVAYVPVLLTDDEETALTIRSLAGKDVLLSGHAVPVNPAKLSAFKRALRAKGVVLDEDEPPASGRRRGRR